MEQEGDIHGAHSGTDCDWNVCPYFIPSDEVLADDLHEIDFVMMGPRPGGCGKNSLAILSLYQPAGSDGQSKQRRCRN